MVTSVAATLAVPAAVTGIPVAQAESNEAPSTTQLIVKMKEDQPSVQQLTRSVNAVVENIQVVETSKSMELVEVVSENKIDKDIQVVEASENFVVIDVDSSKIGEISETLINYENVEYVEENKIYSIAATNDTYADSQWNLKAINAEEAWADLDGTPNLSENDVVVAVLDTGVQHDHEDLEGRILDGASFVGQEVADKGADDQGHGTFVSGFIAANADNELGIAGVTGNQNVKILPVKVMDKNGSGTALDIAKGIDYAVAKDVDVINMSLSGEYSETIDKAVQKAADAGIVVVAASGNGGGNADVSFPAALPNVISVGALAANDQHYTRSNVGETVDLTAPGAGVLSTSMTTEKYTTGSGTSYAAPHVSAVAALYKLKNPNASAIEIEEALKVTAKDLGTAGWDAKTGYGKVDAAAALAGNVKIKTAGFTLPKANAELLGSTTIQLSITDITDVKEVKLYADGTEISTNESPTNTPTFDWDTTKVEDGDYTLKAVLVDANGAEMEAITREVKVFNKAVSGYMFDVKTPTGTTAKAANVMLYEKVEAENGTYSYKEVWTGLTDSEGIVRVPSYVGTDLKTLQVLVQGTFDASADEGNTWFMYNREVATTGTVELSSNNTVPLALKTTDTNNNELPGAEYFIAMQDKNGVELTAPKQINNSNAELSPTVYVDKGVYDIHSYFKAQEGTYFLSSTNTQVTDTATIAFNAADAGEIAVNDTDESQVENAVLYLYNNDVTSIFGSGQVISGKKFFVTPGDYQYMVEAEVKDTIENKENWIYVFENNKNIAKVTKGAKTEVQVGGALALTKLESDYASLKRYYTQRGLDYVERDETKDIAHKIDGAFYTTQEFTDAYGNMLVGLRRGSLSSEDAIYQKNIETGETTTFEDGEATVSAIDFGNIYAKYKVVNKANGKTILDSYAKNPANAANRGYYWYAFWVTTSSDITAGTHEVSLELDPTPLSPNGLSKSIKVEMQDSSVDLQIQDTAGVSKQAYVTLMSATKDEHGDYSWDTHLTKWTDANKKLSIPTNFKTSAKNVAIIRYSMPSGEYAYLFKDFEDVEDLNTTIVIPNNMQKVAINAYNGDAALTGVSTKQWLIKHAVEIDGQTVYATANNLQNYKKDSIYLAPGSYTFEGNYVSLPDKDLKRSNYYFLNPDVEIKGSGTNEVKFDTSKLAKVNVHADTEGFTDVRGAIVYPYNKYSDAFTSTLRVGHEFYVPANLDMNLQVQLGYGDKESTDVIWNYFLSKGTQTFKENEEIDWTVGGQFSAQVDLAETRFAPGTIQLEGHAAIKDSHDNNITSVLVNKTSDYSISEDNEKIYILKNGEIIEATVDAEGAYTIAHSEAPAADTKSFKPVLKVYNAQNEVLFEKADLSYYTAFNHITLNNLVAGSYRAEIALAASPQGPIASAKNYGVFNVVAPAISGGTGTGTGSNTTTPGDGSATSPTPAPVENGTTQAISPEAIQQNKELEVQLNNVKVTIPTQQLAAVAHTVTIEEIDGKLHFSVSANNEEVQLNDYVKLEFSSTPFTNSKKFAFVRVLEDGTFAAIPHTLKDGIVTMQTRKGGTFAINEEQKPFADLVNNGFADYIQELTLRAIINGTSDTTFEPNTASTRAHFASVLARALDLSASKKSTFTDTKGKWFEKEVQALFETGIVRGKDSATFDPNAPVTREQAALMLVRVIEFLNIDANATDEKINSFTDINSISPEAQEAVQLLQKLGIFTGNNDGSFAPKGQLTRGQMAKIMYKILELAKFL